MNKLLFNFLALSILTILLNACLCRERTKVEPPYPAKVSGWSRSLDHGVASHGDFLLRVGETTTNGKIQVKVINIILEDLCAEMGTLDTLDRVTFQFIRMSDKKILCEDTFGEKQTISMSAGHCNNILDEFNITDIHISAINTKEKWVLFVLYA